ncbi:MAG TPA: response regulator transcription factor [Leucothrix mucor]|nr:response regulator transcription factor [Leucothrix mucor]
MSKIIIVEDDPSIAEILQYHLRDLGYEVVHFDNGATARTYLAEAEYDLVLLDIMLPDYNGLDLCRELRQQRPSVPIMLLTSLDSEADRVVGLELGADDYLTKPFSIRECQARIKSLLRRCELNSQTNKEGGATSEAKQDFIHEELSINAATREVVLNKQVIELTQREFDLLLHLANHRQQVFSRAQLLDAVWGYSHDGYEATVNTHINRLRKKLKRNDGKDNFIKTVWGVGYKFISPVE